MNEPSNSKFVTRKWDIVNNQLKANYNVGNEIIYNTGVLKSNPCDYSGAYILVKDDRSGNTCSIYKLCTITKCITKINGTTIDDAEVLDLIMSMYNLVEGSSNYSEVTESLYFYSKDGANNFNAVIANDNNSKSFKYKAKSLRNTVSDGKIRNKKYNYCCSIKIFK